MVKNLEHSVILLDKLLNEFYFNKAYYAHVKKNNNISLYETLFEHSQRSLYTTFYFLKNLNYNSIFLDDTKFNSTQILFNKILLKGLLFASSFHDYGKLNYYFQYEKMANKNITISDFEHFNFVFSDTSSEKIIDTKTSNHSRFNLLSYNEKIFYDFIKDDLDNFIDIYDINKLPGRNKKKKINYLSNQFKYLFQFLIEGHHDGIKESININNISLFKDIYVETDVLFLIEILHSLLINSDVLATKYFMENNTSLISLNDYLYNNFKYISNEITLQNISDIEIKQFYNQNIYSSANNFNFSDEFEKINNLNDLKQIFGTSILDNIKNTTVLDNNFLFLEGKVGIGKTNLSFIIANEILKKDSSKNKIIYVAPLNHLLYQTKNELLNNTFFEENNINIINNIEREKNKETNLKDSYFYENFNKNFILTSAVNFYEKLFHKNKKDISHLLYLKDSIIFIDELQLINDKYFNLSYQYLYLLSKYLNCKIIIMSGTLPLTSFIKNMLDNKIPYILNKSKLDKLNNHPLLNRNSYNLNYFNDTNNDFSNLINSFQKILQKKDNNSVLIVNNSISKLNKSYEVLKKYIPNDYEVRFFHNNILNFINNETLSLIKEGKKIIVFATRKIETGIDISFSQGIKSIDSIDNIYQFSGRINRYNEFSDSEIFILEDKNIYFSQQERERITKIYCSNKDIVSEFINDITKYYYEIFEKNSKTDAPLDLLYNLNIYNLNQIKLINDYEKENFIINIDFKQNNYLFDKLSPSTISFIREHNINSSIDLFDKSKSYFYLGNINSIQKEFIISGFVSKYSDFGKELHLLKEIDISKSNKNIDLYKIIDLDNYYYDLNLGLLFNKSIDESEILDTFNI